WRLSAALAGEPYETGTARRLARDACSKANKLLAGIDRADVRPMERKTGQFYLSILDPDRPEAVCIDRHAYDIAVGIPLGDWNRGLSARGRYKLVADCYREAARRLEQLPSVVQAVTWVVWRNSLAGVGTRGSRV